MAAYSLGSEWLVSASHSQPQDTPAEQDSPRRFATAAPATINTGASLVSSSVGEQVLETVVPIKNGPALLSYYTGLFSLFPVFGLPLAIVAIISGRRGLSNAKENPAVHGKVHAWIGLVCGWLFGLFNLVLVGLLGVAIGRCFRRVKNWIIRLRAIRNSQSRKRRLAGSGSHRWTAPETATFTS